MSNDYLGPIMCKILEDDNTILAACDSHITHGNEGYTLQDAKLTDTKETAIWVFQVSKTEGGYLDSTTNNNWHFDIIMQVDVKSKASYDSARDLADLVETELKTTVEKLYNGATVPLQILLHSRTSLFDDTLGAWVEMLRFRCQGDY